MPGAGKTQRLPRNIPYARAMEMLLTGESIDVQEAYRLGLINKIVSKDSLMEEAFQMAGKLCERGPLAMRAIKEAVLRGMAFETGLNFEAFLFDSLQKTEDSHEGTRAYAEKRKPQFKGK